MLIYITRFFASNIYLIIGIFIGLYFTTLFSSNIQPTCDISGPFTPTPLGDVVGNQTPLKVNTPKKITPGSGQKKLIRPRYYSTELGIREKVFLGIFTSEEKIDGQAQHLNKTVGHLVDKIKFFFTAQHKLKKKYNLTGLVGFTDTRHKYRPFQVIKYVGDNFIQDYDYYYFGYDHTFINGRKLVDIVKKISVSMHVYLGTKVEDGSFCQLDAGIIISNSVLKAIRDHLDWCVINAVSEDHSENLGRCIHHSIGLSCQESIQGQTFDNIKLKHFELKSHLLELSERDDFNKAVTIHPVIGGDNFYLLNAYFLRQRLANIKQNIDHLSADLTEIWPPGQRPGAKPATRFDLPRQVYFNITHMFYADDFTTIRAHKESELLDIKNIIEYIVAKFELDYSNKYQYRRLINGYRSFDLSRGMDYVIDLGFRDLTTGKEVVKRFEVCKPLGKVEFIPMPYVTENSRVTIVLPIQEFETDLGMEFLTEYSTNIMDKKERVLLMLALIYKNETSSKGTDDIFGKIKIFAEQTSNKYKNEDIKIAWVSIRLPQTIKPLTLQMNDALNYAVIDLALKKIGLASLILTLDVYSNITVDFLNRVRMNTIPGTQVFSPIPFRQYNPKISQYSTIDINKNTGHFDVEEFKYISFYSNDYVDVRKRSESKVPIIRVDNDIALITDERYHSLGNVFEMFLKFAENIHCMRATETGLKVRYHEETDENRSNLFIANAPQLAKFLLTNKNQIPILS